MNLRTLSLILGVLFVSGCMTGKPALVSAPPINTCPMPVGYRMAPAIETAKQTLRNCPEKLNEVFSAVLEVAKHSPSPENSTLIQEMLKELVKQNKVSEIYSRNLYQKHFSRSFVSIPDTKVYRIAGEIDSIKKDLQRELGLKRIGMIECSNDKETYGKAEGEYARLVNFLENLSLNEQYLAR